MSFIKPIACSTFAILALSVLMQSGFCAAQEPVDQAKAVRAIYDATKTSKTEKEFTAFIAQCEDLLEGKLVKGELSQANRDYVVSLRGWALNRRGEKRFELVKQLRKVGNRQEAAVMKLAMEDFDEAILVDPERVRSWMSRGIANVENDDLDSALRDFTKVTELKADESKGWFNRAETLYQRGNFDYAIKDYNVVLRLNSLDVQALTGRGLSALSMGSFEDALVDFEEVIRLQPRSHTALINRGDALQGLGRWQAAQTDYRGSLKIRETGIGFQRSAWLLATCPDAQIRDEQLAAKQIERAIAMSGKTPLNLDTLAATKAAEGDFAQAKTTQQEVIGLVGAEEESSEPFKARLSLYEKDEPFVQSKSADPTPEPESGKKDN